MLLCTYGFTLLNQFGFGVQTVLHVTTMVRSFVFVSEIRTSGNFVTRWDKFLFRLLEGRRVDDWGGRHISLFVMRVRMTHVEHYFTRGLCRHRVFHPEVDAGCESRATSIGRRSAAPRCIARFLGKPSRKPILLMIAIPIQF